MSLCLIAIYLTLGSLIFLGLSLYLWALPMVVPLVNPGGGTLPLLQNRSEAQERLLLPCLFHSFILPTFASLWPQERGHPLPQLCDWDRARGAGLARFRPLRHREDVKAGARFREKKGCSGGHWAHWGRGEDGASDKDPRVFVAGSLRNGPLPHRGYRAHQVSRPLNSTSLGWRAGDIHVLSNWCSRLQIPKKAGMKRPSLRGW